MEPAFRDMKENFHCNFYDVDTLNDGLNWMTNVTFSISFDIYKLLIMCKC